MTFKLSEKAKPYVRDIRCYKEPDIKEFIRLDCQLTNHFLWDLFREWEIDEDVIEKEITKLSDKKDKLTGFSEEKKFEGEE